MAGLRGWPRALAILFVMAGAVTAGFLMAEVLIRVVNPPMDYGYMPAEVYVSHFRPSTFLNAELRRNNRSRFKMLEFDTTVVTNSLGLRDNEVDFGKPRILCMGDSFTFGFGVENHETFCARLEALSGGKYDFVNAGFADGFSPDTYALWLSKYREQLSPQAILVSFFVNDRTDVADNTWLKNGAAMTAADSGLPERIVRPGFIVTDDGAGMRDNVLVKLPPIVRRWLKMSYVVALLRDRLFHDAGSGSTPIESAARPDEEAIDAKFNRALELLREQAADRRLIFYVIGGPRTAGSAAPDVATLVNAFAARHGITVLSNDGDFSPHDFFPLDSHFTRDGHAKAAAYLHRSLAGLGF